MNLKELKDYFEEMPKGVVFKFELSDPFSWRGSYDEVCFSIAIGESNREKALKCINEAYEGVFVGWKGGEYQYNDFTPVNFETEEGSYSGGDYCRRLIEEIQDEPEFIDYEHKLVNLAFN